MSITIKWNNFTIMPMPRHSEYRVSCMIAHSLGLHQQADLLEMVLDLQEHALSYLIKSKEYEYVHVDLPSRLD